VKDYLDIHALLTTGKLGLAAGLANAKAIYGRQYDPMLTLQALTYFNDLRELLSEQVKADLFAAVQSVSLHALPAVGASSGFGAIRQRK
jgi:hypothetical protein